MRRTKLMGSGAESMLLQSTEIKTKSYTSQLLFWYIENK